MKTAMLPAPRYSTFEWMPRKYPINSLAKTRQASPGMITQYQTVAQNMPTHRIAKEQLAAVNTSIRLV